MFHYMFRPEFATLVSLKSPVGKLAAGTSLENPTRHALCLVGYTYDTL